MGVQAKALYQILQGARENILPKHHCVIAAAMVGWGESPCQEELAGMAGSSKSGSHATVEIT